jgi:hypothetical protein
MLYFSIAPSEMLDAVRYVYMLQQIFKFDWEKTIDNLMSIITHCFLGRKISYNS